MKKIIPFAVIIFVLALAVSPSFAMEKSAKIRDEIRAMKEVNVSKTATASEKVKEKRMENLNDRAKREIDRRIASLNKLSDRLKSIKRLTETQKLSLFTQIQTEITNLEALRAKIEADTDPVVLKADVQSIVKSYRIYALFIPKIEIIIAADRELNTADKLSSVGAKLQSRIDTAKAASNDTAALQTLLDELMVKVADVRVQADNAINTVLPLTPEGFPGNISILKSARSMLKTGHLDLVAANQNAKKIRQGLHLLEKNKSGTSSAAESE